jgi:hypothetical protein
MSSSLNSAICENTLKPTVLIRQQSEDNTMGNFADKTFKDGFNIGWLTAAIEGEGHITLAWCRKSNGYIQIMPRIGMNNQAKEFIDTAKGICESLDIPCYIHQYKNGMFAMHWYGMKRVKKMLGVLMPYLTFKRERAQLVLDFINYRLAKNPHIKYGSYEKEIFMKIRDIHGKGWILHKDLQLAFESNLNDYTLNTQRITTQSEDIVCSA